MIYVRCFEINIILTNPIFYTILLSTLNTIIFLLSVYLFMLKQLILTDKL